jgi:uncharacterized membrane protein YfbV (UPF0208 family)
MIAKTSAIDPIIRAAGTMTQFTQRLSAEISAMTLRTTAVAGALVGAAIPLAQFSYDEPVKGIIIAAMLPTPTVRRLICKAAGIQSR